MPDERRVAVVIAAADAAPAAFLAGALNAAKEFAAWARALGYETYPITDEEKPVTIARLETELQALLPARAADGTLGRPIHRLIVYFAGHGLIREAEEGLWLLSDWHDTLRAVAVEPFKRRLYAYGVKQICIIADACRELPANVSQSDLAPDPVLGRGPVTIDRAPPVDKYIAAQDGAQSYAVAGDEPEHDRCIFSGVLMDGLWGADGAISALMPGKVTSRSLGAYLQTEAPKRAQTYRLTLNPDVTPIFPDEDCIYFDKASAPARPPTSVWPPGPPPLLRSQGPFTVERDALITTHRLTTELQRAPTVLLKLPVETDAAKFMPPAIAHAVQLWPQPGYATLVASGAAVTAIHARAGIEVQRDPATGGWRTGRLADHASEWTPVLVEFSDGVFCPIAAYPGCTIALVRDAIGAAAVTYHDPNYGGGTGAPGPTEKAIAEMEAGALRADDAVDIAVHLRMNKHADPVLGVISAYLYDAISDTDSIRRMAAFYVEAGQPVPYDVALLALVRGEQRGADLWVQIPDVPAAEPRSDLERANPFAFSATHATAGRVGGAWPWMRQGWAFLEDPLDVEATLILPALSEMAKDLKPARFTTFGAQGGALFAQAFELGKTPA